jgi:phosphopantetheinyl transferase (holo-ACP synthase)
MEIRSDADGVPSFEVKDEARSVMESLGADKIHLSISHTTEHAVAQIVLEKI